MPDIPIENPLGYVGVLFLIIGSFLILTGFEIVKIEKITVLPGKKTWRLGIITVVIGVLLLLPDVTKSYQSILPAPVTSQQASASNETEKPPVTQTEASIMISSQ